MTDAGDPRVQQRQVNLLVRLATSCLLAVSAMICFLLEAIGHNISEGKAGVIGLGYAMLAIVLALPGRRGYWYVLGAIALIPMLLLFIVPTSLKS